MRTIMYALGGSAGLVGAAYFYLRSKTQVRQFPESTFCFREVQATYTSLGPEFQRLEKDKTPYAEYFKKDELSIMAVHFDNPNWMKDVSQCRSGLGYVIGKGVPLAIKAKLSDNMHSSSLPAFRALTIPAHFCQCGFLYRFYLSILFYKYFSTYMNELKQTNTLPFVIACSMHSGSGSVLFLPVPSDLKTFNFAQTKQAELNEQGKEMVQRYKVVAPIAPERPRAEAVKPAAPVPPVTPSAPVAGGVKKE